MDILKINKKFQLQKIEREDIEWHDATAWPQFLFGIYYDNKAERYFRMPQEIAKKVNEGVTNGCKKTAGGRLRFKTNSSFVAIQCLIDDEPGLYHMPLTGSHGFGLYRKGAYFGTMSPKISDVQNAIDGEIAFQSLQELYIDAVEEIELYFPLYNGVKKLYIGLEKGCVIESVNDFAYQKPVVFYGSSITQGACASHPGNDYQSHLSRWLNFDFINLGFSGAAQGEQEMSDYIATLKASVFVIDYDHNAPSVAYLEKTYYPFYKTIRSAHPDTPILFMSKPDFDRGGSVARRTVIYNAYKRAKKEGDKHVWFVDGKNAFGKLDRSACTVDTVHPNDLGFYRIAKNIRPVLQKALNSQNKEG